MAGMFDNLTFGFNANDPVSPEGMALRQRIAMQMMGQGGRKGYPKNAGEGLTAIGDSLGDIGMANRLERQMAGLEARSAARAPLPATLPPAAAPRGTDPSVRSDVFDTGAAPVQFANVPDAVDTAPPPMQTADAAPAATGPANAVQASQLATLLGTGGGDQTPSYAPTASADANAPVVEQAPPGNLSPAAAQVRSRIAATYPQAVTAPGVQQPNPTLGAVPAALSASTAPMVPPPEQAGSPDEAADNRPIVLAQNGARPAPVKEPGMVADPVPTPETTTRYQPSPKIIKQGEFSSPPRIADPGPEELNLLRAASDPNVLGSYQTQYKERAAELAQQRKDNYDQQLKAWTAKDQMLQTERANEQTFERGKSERDMNIKKLEDEAQQRARTEKFARVLGPGGWEGTSKSIEDSYKKVEGLAQQSKAINDIQSALQDNKMYTGSAADLQNTRAKILHVLGWRLDPKVVDTERFATLMAPIVAANRRMISGNQNISDKDVETALKASGGDPKLEKESLLTILNDLREGSLSMAINHQRMLRGVTGAINEPDWTNTIYTQKGTPNMHQLVPQSAVNELLASPTEDAKSEFDDAFHTPGLANQVLRFRKRSQ